MSKRKTHNVETYKGNYLGFKGWITKCTCGYYQGNFHKDKANEAKLKHEGEK